MKKEAVKNQRKDVKPAANVKCNPGKQGNVKKTGGTVKKVAVEMEQPPEQQVADSAIVPPVSETDVCQDNTEQVEVVTESELAAVTETPPEPQVADTVTVTIPKESKVLRERLGLNGYITETVKLPPTLEILGCKAEGVVFARQIEGVPINRILLHVTLVSATGKHSIVSSRKKVPQPEWQALTEALTGMSITWRDRELKRAAK